MNEKARIVARKKMLRFIQLVKEQARICDIDTYVLTTLVKLEKVTPPGGERNVVFGFGGIGDPEEAAYCIRHMRDNLPNDIRQHLLELFALETEKMAASSLLNFN